MRAALHLFLSLAAVILLVHGIGSHDGHPEGSLVAPAEPIMPVAGPPPAVAPMPALEDIDHDGCPKPWESPCAAGWVKPSPPPSRHGGQPPQKARATAEAALRAAMPGPDVSALRWTRPAGPRLPIFRC